MARGRKRREGVNRYPGGSIVNDERGESETEAKATVLRARASRVGAEHAHKYECSFELGVAYLRGYITRQQLKAGEHWAFVVDRHHRMNGFPSPFPKAMDWLSAKGRAGDYEPTPDHIRTVANDYMRSYTATAKFGRHTELACQSLCLHDVPPWAWPDHTWKALRKGLDALASLYAIPDYDVENSDEAA